MQREPFAESTMEPRMLKGPISELRKLNDMLEGLGLVSEKNSENLAKTYTKVLTYRHNGITYKVRIFGDENTGEGSVKIRVVETK